MRGKKGHSSTHPSSWSKRSINVKKADGIRDRTLGQWWELGSSCGHFGVAIEFFCGAFLMGEVGKGER